MKKNNLILFLLIPLLLFTFTPVSALTVSSTYGDVSSTSSQAINLINYAMSYDTFQKSDYVIYNDVQYSYYIVWSDNLKVNNNVVTGSDIEYIHYYRDSTSGYSSTYTYEYGTDTSFSLSTNYVNTSSLENYGFKSVLYSEYKSYNQETYFLILTTAFIFVIMVKNLRRV